MLVRRLSDVERQKQQVGQVPGQHAPAEGFTPVVVLVTAQGQVVPVPFAVENERPESVGVHAPSVEPGDR